MGRPVTHVATTSTRQPATCSCARVVSVSRSRSCCHTILKERLALRSLCLTLSRFANQRTMLLLQLHHKKARNNKRELYYLLVRVYREYVNIKAFGFLKKKS